MKKMKHLTFFALAALLSTALVSCEKDEIGVTDIYYILTLSPDLLDYVTPEVRYVDARGEVVTLTGLDELDSKAAENSSTSSWTFGADLKNVRMYCIYHSQCNYNPNSHSYMTVTYLRKDSVEDAADKISYDFCHNLRSYIGVSHKEKRDFNVNFFISMLPDPYSDTLQGDEIDDYLDKLCAYPDKDGYYIDKNGHPTQRAEGE